MPVLLHVGLEVSPFLRISNSIVKYNHFIGDLLNLCRMSKFTFLIALLVVVCGIIQTRADVEDAWQQYLVKLYSLMKEFHLIQFCQF
jgi:hypothetical protein